VKTWAHLGCGSASLFFALSLIAASPELHVIGLGDSPNFISLYDASGKAMRLEVAGQHFSPATAITLTGRLRLESEAREDGRPAVAIGELELPAQGRHLLLLSPLRGSSVRATLIPADVQAFPAGSVAFLNLTSRELRCAVDGEHIDLKAGAVSRIPLANTGRVAVNHRLHVKVKQSWVLENSTTLMVGPRRRCLIVFTENDPKEQIGRSLVIDVNPAQHLAPLAESFVVRPVSEPVKAEPPLPDPPAK
jgi:hypothetical protein